MPQENVQEILMDIMLRLEQHDYLNYQEQDELLKDLENAIDISGDELPKPIKQMSPAIPTNATNNYSSIKWTGFGILLGISFLGIIILISFLCLIGAN